MTALNGSSVSGIYDDVFDNISFGDSGDGESGDLFALRVAFLSKSQEKNPTFEGLSCRKFGLNQEDQRVKLSSDYIEKYKVFVESVNVKNSRLRLDLSGKFYIITQSTEGISKIIDIVKNFFIKLAREGLRADAILEKRLAEQFVLALEHGSFNQLLDYSEQIGEIGSEKNPLECLRKMNQSLDRFGEILRRARELSIREERSGELFNRIDVMVDKLKSILNVMIVAHQRSRNPDIAEIRDIGQTVLRDGEEAALKKVRLKEAEAKRTEERDRAIVLTCQLEELENQISDYIVPWFLDTKKQLANAMKEYEEHCSEIESKTLEDAKQEVTAIPAGLQAIESEITASGSFVEFGLVAPKSDASTIAHPSSEPLCEFSTGSREAAAEDVEELMTEPKQMSLCQKRIEGEYQPRAEELFKQAEKFQLEQKHHQSTAAKLVELARSQKAKLERLLKDVQDAIDGAEELGLT